MMSSILRLEGNVSRWTAKEKWKVVEPKKVEAYQHKCVAHIKNDLNMNLGASQGRPQAWNAKDQP